LQVSGGVGVGGNLYIGGSAGNSIVATGNINLSGNILPTGANTIYNIGSVSNWFNNIYGTAVHAQYADLAENYKADDSYVPGTVVIFGGDQEITVTDQFADVRVAGVISTDPAYLMNSAQPGLPLALRGRVPVNVVGVVKKGDGLVTSVVPGYAQSVGTNGDYARAVFAKSLVDDNEPGMKIITAVIL
jgi:hypothetical protein